MPDQIQFVHVLRLAAVATCFSTAEAFGQSCEILENQKHYAPNAAQHDRFGDAVAVDGDTAVVGAPTLLVGAAGSASVMTYANGQWSTPQVLVPTPSAPNDRFGASVAIWDDVIVIGAPACCGVTNNPSGKAFVFRRIGQQWMQEAVLSAEDATSGDEFGVSVAIHGNVLVVGAPSIALNGAYVFRHNGTNWVQEQKLLQPAGESSNRFGSSVAVVDDQVFVGSPGGFGSGRVYVYRYQTLTWSHSQTLSPADAAGRFGEVIAARNSTAVIGAPWSGPAQAGAAYVFDLNGRSWQQTQKLTAPGGESNDHFGAAVDLRTQLIVVGAPDTDVTTWTEFDSGMTYVFHKVNSTWSMKNSLRASDPEVVSGIGAGVGIGTDSLLVGAPTATLGISQVYDVGEVLAFPIDPPDCDRDGTPDRCDGPDCNNDRVTDSCQIASGSAGDCDANGVPDHCQAMVTYALDDGTSEQVYGYGSAWDSLWVNQFTVQPGGRRITHISIAWSYYCPEQIPITLVLYRDPNNDGNPADAQLLMTAATQTFAYPYSRSQTPMFLTVPVPPTYVGRAGDSFFVGAFGTFDETVAHRVVDATSPQQRTWKAAAIPGTMNLNNPGLQPLIFPVYNAMVRALSLDCNANGIWDSCDITNGSSLDVNTNGIPDECEQNCQADIAPGFGAGDGVINIDDLVWVITHWGPCPAPPVTCAGNINGDESVNIDDLVAVITAWGTCP